MKLNDKFIKGKEFYHDMKESLEDIDYVFKNGKDELRIRVDKREERNVTDYSLNGNHNCPLPSWARDIITDSISFPSKSNEIRKALKI
ncbi:hypothetical protein M1E11_18720 [Bacillus sp. JZ8]